MEQQRIYKVQVWVIGFISMIALSGCQSLQLNSNDWDQYKSRFVNSSGRVIDTGNSDMSHSEGQAYGMRLAVAFSDKRTFDSIWSWTQKNLQVREQDMLFAWKWDPVYRRVGDMNNATDAELVIAWSLFLAAEKWNEPKYLEAGRQIINDLKRLLVNINGNAYLLPGMIGNEHNGVIRLNPSYLIFPVFRYFESRNKQLNWNSLYHSGLELLRQARFGRWMLAPDWLDLHPEVEPSKSNKHVFSYDAIRIPLFAAWAGESEVLKPYVTMWNSVDMSQGVPDVVDLSSNAIHMTKSFSAPQAIYALSKKVLGEAGSASFPTMVWKEDTHYYDASLMLFAQIAWIESANSDRK